MQAIVLLLLRFSTGSYLTIWGLLKLMSPETALKVSDKYYSGMLNADIINYGLGAVQVALGVLVILGLFRKLVYPAQAFVYFAGLVAIAPYILDPFGLYLVESAKVTFYPSTTLFFAALVMIVFKSHDSLSMDTKRRKR